jgi:hypothetical protein
VKIIEKRAIVGNRGGARIVAVCKAQQGKKAHHLEFVQERKAKDAIGGDSWIREEPSIALRTIVNGTADRNAIESQMKEFIEACSAVAEALKQADAMQS